MCILSVSSEFSLPVPLIGTGLKQANKCVMVIVITDIQTWSAGFYHSYAQKKPLN